VAKAKAKPKRPSQRARAKKGWRACGRTKDTLQRLEKVIELLKVHGVINVACRQSIIAGRALSKQTYYEMRHDYPDFTEETDDAIAQSVEELEASGMACARMAQRDPRYIPMLRMALEVKAGWSRAQRIELTGKGSGPIESSVTLKGELDQLSDEELEARYRAKLVERGLAS
jgi:hypothetical protein